MAISTRRARADVQAGGCVELLGQLRRDGKLGADGGSPLRAGHERHVWHPGLERRRQDLLLAAAVRGHDDRRGAVSAADVGGRPSSES